MLLASFNGAEWIGEQINSILCQEGVDHRIIIGDDGSSDGTLKEVARFATTGKVELLRRSPASGSAAQNFLRLIRATSASGFDYVALADQDDVWYRDKLSRACRTLHNSSSVGYSSATIATWSDGRTRILRQSQRPRSGDFLFEGAGQGCTYVLRADFYNHVREFVAAHPQLTRELHYHDWMIYALARSWGYSWTFDPLPSVRYRQHSSNDTGARSTLGGVRKRLALIKGRWYRAQIDAILKVCNEAAGQNPVIASWKFNFHSPDKWSRRLRIAGFSLRAGRRKPVDNAVVTLAALAGWI